MNDPQRLVDELEGDAAHELVRAVRRDAPSASARERTLLALGIGGSIAGTSTVATSSAWSSLPVRSPHSANGLRISRTDATSSAAADSSRSTES